MPNGMPSWEQWRELSEDARQYEFHRILSGILDRLKDQPRTCEKRFAKLEKRKKWNSAESLIGGIFGGILTVIGGWAFWRGPP